VYFLLLPPPPLASFLFLRKVSPALLFRYISVLVNGAKIVRGTKLKMEKREEENMRNNKKFRMR
jgi:hypothetical protein